MSGKTTKNCFTECGDPEWGHSSAKRSEHSYIPSCWLVDRKGIRPQKSVVKSLFLEQARKKTNHTVTWKMTVKTVVEATQLLTRQS